MYGTLGSDEAFLYCASRAYVLYTCADTQRTRCNSHHDAEYMCATLKVEYIREDIVCTPALEATFEQNHMELDEAHRFQKTATEQLAQLGLTKQHVVLALQYRTCKQAVLQAAASAFGCGPNGNAA